MIVVTIVIKLVIHKLRVVCRQQKNKVIVSVGYQMNKNIFSSFLSSFPNMFFQVHKARPFEQNYNQFKKWERSSLYQTCINRRATIWLTSTGTSSSIASCKLLHCHLVSYRLLRCIFLFYFIISHCMLFCRHGQIAAPCGEI